MFYFVLEMSVFQRDILLHNTLLSHFTSEKFREIQKMKEKLIIFFYLNERSQHGRL